MPISISKAEILTATRIIASSGATVPTGIDETADFILTAVREILNDVEDKSLTIPQEVLNLAAIRLFSYWWDNDPSLSRGTSNGYTASGAAAILASYRMQTSAIVGASRSERSPATPSTGTPGVDEVARAGVEENKQAIAALENSGVDTTARAGVAANAAAIAGKQNQLMPPSPAEAAAGTSTTIRGWTSALIRTAINAVVPTWARTGDSTKIPAAKLPASSTGLPDTTSHAGRVLSVGSNLAAFWDLASDVLLRGLGNLTGQKNKFLAIGSDENSIIFADAPSGTLTDDQVAEVSSAAAKTGFIRLEDDWEPFGGDNPGIFRWNHAGGNSASLVAISNNLAEEADDVETLTNTSITSQWLYLGTVKGDSSLNLGLYRFEILDANDNIIRTVPLGSISQLVGEIVRDATTYEVKAIRVTGLPTGVKKIRIGSLTDENAIATWTGNVPGVDALATLPDSVRELHDLLDSVTATTGAVTNWANLLTDFTHGHFQVGWAAIQSDGTEDPDGGTHTSNSVPHTVFAADVGSRVLVHWAGIGVDPATRRIQHHRGGTLVATYPRNGEYWRRYDSTTDELLQRFGHYDAYFLASESSDAPISVGLQQGDHLTIQGGDIVEMVSIPLTALAAAVANRLLPAPTVGNKGKFAAIKPDGSAWEVVDAPAGSESQTPAQGGGATSFGKVTNSAASISGTTVRTIMNALQTWWKGQADGAVLEIRWQVTAFTGAGATLRHFPASETIVVTGNTPYEIYSTDVAPTGNILSGNLYAAVANLTFQPGDPNAGGSMDAAFSGFTFNNSYSFEAWGRVL